ncbi:MAG: hypothetical protein QMD85_03645, partial [Candidatus Aenigmarchaeota archaeon]|nr:hypothetical protein [Candidatus Aenigmarchaeota archaeon]MDI6722649.1 hypothetical protein [Candidatus Aenigmarchaeota archaeon]
GFGRTGRIVWNYMNRRRKSEERESTMYEVYNVLSELPEDSKVDLFFTEGDGVNPFFRRIQGTTSPRKASSMLNDLCSEYSYGCEKIVRLEKWTNPKRGQGAPRLL